LPAKALSSDPVPAPLAKAKGAYRYQIIVRHPSTLALVAAIRGVLKDFRLPQGVFCTVDVDAMNLI
jgi:primosomal protein N'